MTAFSFSAIKTFKQCPKKYYHLKVAQDVKDKPGEAAMYGSDAHTAAEVYIRDGVPIPGRYKIMRPIVEALEKFEGEKHPEIKLGVKKTEDGYEACSFDDPAAWYRGIADLVIINGSMAYCIDYKTGKSSHYADIKQLDLMAGALFLLYPDLTVIKSALAFVVPGDFIRKIHKVELTDEYLGVFKHELAELSGAHDNGVWNAKQGPLCGWCPVVECEHNTKGANRRW